MRVGARGLVVKVERDPDDLPQCPAPAGEILRRLAVHRVHGKEGGPALGACGSLHLCRICAEGRETAITEAQHGEGRGRGHPRQPIEEAFRGRGRVTFAIGGAEDEEAVRPGVARRVKGRHRRDVDRLTRIPQGARQRRGKTPSAAAFGADKDHRLRAARGRIVAQPGPATPPAAQISTPVAPMTGTLSAIRPRISPSNAAP